MSNIYFAKDKPEVLVAHVQGKAADWYKNIQVNRYLDKLIRSWNAYYGNYYDDPHNISFGGEQGELVNLAINHYKNIATNMLNMITGSRPSFQSRAVNTDRKSLIQAELSNGLLDYYMREKRLERQLKKCAEISIVMASAYLKMEWNSTKGELVDYLEIDPKSIASINEDGQALDENGNVLEPFPIYEGDLEFKALSPLDVYFDSTKEDPEHHDWIICRSYINKHDLAAKYPELKDKIIASNTKDKEQGQRVTLMAHDETNDVAIYEFFHKRSESVPNGRYVLYLDKEVILEDTIMIYDRLPVYRIAPSDIIGTSFGYTPMFDLLPIQDAVNSLYSATLTNQNAFAVQNILNPEGNNIKLNQLEGGLNFLEYTPMPNVAGGGKPESLQLTNTPAEVFQFLQMLEKAMEVISGVNAVARGNPDKAITSGNALALIQSQALQFMSGLQQSYIQLLEDVGTGAIKLLQQFANTPRVAAIVGINKATKLRHFSSKDIKDINRVVVDVGNALMQSTAGRAQVAENLLQMMPDKMTPEKYIQVLSTGSLDIMVEGVMNEMDTIRDENETLIKGGVPIAISVDHHALHIREHRDVISNQQLREDPDLVTRTLNHIQEHLDLMRTTNPDLLAIIGEQPLAPQPPPPPQNGAVGNPQMMQDPNTPPPTVDGTSVQPATPPEGFENLPQTPDQLMKQNS